MMMKTPNDKVKAEFEKNKYVTIPKVLGEQTLDFIYSYIKMFSDRREIVIKYLPRYYFPLEHGWKGDKKDYVAPDAFSKYGDMMSETLLLSMRESIEDRIGLELIPTYSYFRLYGKGDDLMLHRDRKSCEISLSLCIGYEGEQWPIYMNGTPLYQEPGDLVIYRGCEIEHHRKPLKGKNQAQVFLHYNNKNGPHGEENLFDGRPFVGLPATDRPQVYKGTRFFEDDKFLKRDNYENTKQEGEGS